MRWSVLWGFVGLSACVTATGEEGPRLELLGDVGGGAVVSVGVGGFGGVGVSTATTSSSTTTTTATTVTTTSGVGGAMTCDTSDEPNDSEDTARDLGAINDCDSNGAQIAHSLEVGDVDWFRYQGSDNFGCVVDPTRSLVTTGELRMCKFAECLEGEVSVTCEDGSSPATSPNLHPGCCHTTGFGMDVDCPGTDDDAIITIRFDQNTTCADYVLDYHY